MNDEGDVFVHGATRYDGLQLIYDPPILVLDAPLVVGKTWQSVAVVYGDLEGVVPTGDTLTVGYEVSSAGDRTVPAGSWFGYAIREALLSGGIENVSHTVAGSPRKVESQPLFENWFVQDVGEIEIQTDEVFKLAVINLPPTTVAAMSWSAIKSLYR
jgi:hypothetical protein